MGGKDGLAGGVAKIDHKCHNGDGGREGVKGGRLFLDNGEMGLAGNLPACRDLGF